MTDRNDDGDPLLVRPYLLDAPGGTAPPPSGPTWPETAPEPAGAAPPADATVVLPVTTAPRRRFGSRRLILILGSVLALVLLGAAAAVSSLLPGPDTSSAGPLDAPLPAPATPAPATTDTPDATGPAPAAPEPTRTRTSSDRSTAPASSPATRGNSASAAPSRTASSPPGPQLLPPPGNRIGRIHGPGGLCLDLNGGVAVDNNHVQVFTCNDTNAQVWTLAADGTLRVAGKCAVAAGDGTVRIAGCDDSREVRWRAGPGGSLVGPAGDSCLTDPGNGTRAGNGVRLETCTQADRQRWQLP